MRYVKYKQKAKRIQQFMDSLGTPLSRVEIINKFREDKLIHKGVNTNERALCFLVEGGKLNKFYAKSGRVMFSSQKSNGGSQ